MRTSLLQKSILKVFPNDTAATVAEIIFLLGIGMLGIVIHAKLRLPMHLPGKQGIFFIALIVAGKGFSKFPFAGTISCIGAATLLLIPGLGFHDPFIAVVYLFLGFIMDLFTGFASRFTSRQWIIAIVCGACWVFIPLFRFCLSLIVDMPLNSLRGGFIYPFATHLLFGITGGLLAASVISFAEKKS